jgi:hypothetical protein
MNRPLLFTLPLDFEQVHEPHESIQPDRLIESVTDDYETKVDR